MRHTGIRPKLIHPTHIAVIWPLDLDGSDLLPDMNSIKNIKYKSSDEVRVPIQRKFTRFKADWFFRSAPVQDTIGYFLVHKDDLINPDGTFKIKRGDLVKKIEEAKNPNITIIFNMFVNENPMPVGNYDTAYLYKIFMEDRSLDETRAEQRSYDPK